ncbi:MAG: hypothetical protein ACKV2Q_18435 [Planctomycetaceae bacterium]
MTPNLPFAPARQSLRPAQLRARLWHTRLACEFHARRGSTRTRAACATMTVPIHSEALKF